MGNTCSKNAYNNVHQPVPINSTGYGANISYDPTVGRFEIQWFNNRTSLIYDYRRYDKSAYQPKGMKPGEEQFNCYVNKCNNYIRVQYSGLKSSINT